MAARSEDLNLYPLSRLILTIIIIQARAEHFTLILNLSESNLFWGLKTDFPPNHTAGHQQGQEQNPEPLTVRPALLFYVLVFVLNSVNMQLNVESVFCL